MNKTKQKKLVPELRFPEFQGEWEKKKFNDIFEILVTNSLSRNKLSKTGSIKNIHYGDIHSKYKSILDLEKIKNIPFIKSPQKKYELCNENDIVLADASEDYNDIGKSIELININNEKITAGLHTFLLRQKSDDKFQKFWGYAFNSPNIRKKFKKIATGTSVLGISKGNIHNLSLNFPCRKEANKIGEILYLLDKKIELLQKQKSALEKYKKGIMQQIFSQQIRFKDENGNDFPNWKEKKLKDIAKKTKEKNIDGKINNILSVTAENGIIKQESFFTKKIANKKNIRNYYLIQENDFAYNPRISSHAKYGPIKKSSFKMGVVSPLYTTFRVNNNINPEYLNYYFQTTLWHKHIHKVANYGARHDRMNIKTSDFFLIPINFPSREEQEVISNFISSIIKVIETSNLILKNYIKFKKSLLQKMFI